MYSSWFGVATTYFAIFGTKVSGIARSDVGGLSGVHSMMFLDWKPTRRILVG